MKEHLIIEKIELLKVPQDAFLLDNPLREGELLLGWNPVGKESRYSKPPCVMGTSHNTSSEGRHQILKTYGKSFYRWLVLQGWSHPDECLFHGIDQKHFWDIKGKFLGVPRLRFIGGAVPTKNEKNVLLDSGDHPGKCYWDKPMRK